MRSEYSKIAILVATCLSSVPAFAQESAPKPADEDTAGAWDRASVVVPPWSEPSGRGVALGLGQGSFTGHWGQELRVKLPLSQAFTLNVGGLYLLDQPRDVHNFGGRLTLTGGTPVYLNLIRLYGGGGAALLLSTDGGGDDALLGGGGFFGFEFFVNADLSFFIEMGGHGGKTYSGATAMAGLNLFPF